MAAELFARVLPRHLQIIHEINGASSSRSRRVIPMIRSGWRGCR